MHDFYNHLINVRSFPVFANTASAPYQVGKWIVSFYDLNGFTSNLTALCVVDDFGNLVKV